MKQLVNKIMIVMLSVVIVMQSCSKSNTAPNTQTSVDPSSTVLSGSWIVSTFAQRAEDKTSIFNGYVFTFVKGGLINAALNGKTVTGSWSFTPSAIGYYGSTPSKASFTINMGTATPLSSLTKTWNVDSVKSSTDILALISPEVVENMQLNFSKIK